MLRMLQFLIFSSRGLVALAADNPVRFALRGLFRGLS